MAFRAPISENNPKLDITTTFYNTHGPTVLDRKSKVAPCLKYTPTPPRPDPFEEPEEESAETLFEKARDWFKLATRQFDEYDEFAAADAYPDMPVDMAGGGYGDYQGMGDDSYDNFAGADPGMDMGMGDDGSGMGMDGMDPGMDPSGMDPSDLGMDGGDMDSMNNAADAVGDDQGNPQDMGDGGDPMGGDNGDPMNPDGDDSSAAGREVNLMALFISTMIVTSLIL